MEVCICGGGGDGFFKEERIELSFLGRVFWADGRVCVNVVGLGMRD